MHVKVDVYFGLAFAMLIFGMSGIDTAEKSSGLKESDRINFTFPEYANYYPAKPGAAVNHVEVLQYA